MSSANKEAKMLTIEEEKASNFSRLIKSQVEGELEDAAYSQPALTSAFVSVGGNYIVQDGGSPEFHAALFDERLGQRKATIYGYAPVDDQGVLRLFTGDYSPDETVRSVGKQAFEHLVARAAYFYACASSGAEMIMSDDVLACVNHIRDAADQIEDVRIIVVSDRRVNASELETESGGITIKSETYDIERLHRISDIAVRRSDIVLDFTQEQCGPVPCIEVSGRDYNYKTYLLMLDGETLYRLFERYGARLYDLNLRSYLQPKTPVNRGILTTIKEAPDRFLAYNNGLSATADEIEAGLENGRVVIRRLVGFQIVNGAQTTSSVHRARKNGLDVSAVHVAVKLTRVEADDLDEIVPLITEYANTQNPIRASDLRANLEFHRLVESLSERIWTPDGQSRWFYERARGSYEAALLRYGTTEKKKKEFKSENPKSQVFKKEEMGIHWMSWHDKPDIASRGAQKNFARFMETVATLVSDGFRPDGDFYRNTIAMIIIAKAAERAIKKSGVSGYKAQVKCYLMALVHERLGEAFRLNRVWREQGVSDALKTLLETWAPLVRDEFVRTANGQNVTEWCKKEACWDALRGMDLPLVAVPEASTEDPAMSDTELDDDAESLKAAAATATIRAPDASKDEENIRLCHTLPEAAWSAIAAWGSKDRILDDFERQITATMLHRSISGWHRLPSAKQAKHAARIVRLAMDQGVIEPILIDA
ncbi:MAG: AIPR family protein [Phreatobacter sp.]